MSIGVERCKALAFMLATSGLLLTGCVTPPGPGSLASASQSASLSSPSTQVEQPVQAEKAEKPGALAEELFQEQSKEAAKTLIDHNPDLKDYVVKKFAAHKVTIEVPPDSQILALQKRKAYLDQNPNVSQKIRDAINSGQVIYGMNRQQAKLVPPEGHDVTKRSDAEGEHEIWVWKEFDQRAVDNRISHLLNLKLYSLEHEYYRKFGGPEPVIKTPTQTWSQATVVFLNGKVVSVEHDTVKD